MRGRDPHDLLRRALAALAPDAAFGASSTVAWSSATFTGARHSVELSFDGPAAQDQARRFNAQLADHEFALRGHLVADIICSTRDTGLTVEALTIEDA